MMPPAVHQQQTNGAPPPSKKQRAVGVPRPPSGSNRDSFSDAADEAIARRRAELRRLQQLRSSRPTLSGSGTQSSTEGLLAMARNQLGQHQHQQQPPGSAPQSMTAAPMQRYPQQPPQQSQQPPKDPQQSPQYPQQSPQYPQQPPQQQGMVRTRHSDIFPSAPKLAQSLTPPVPAPARRQGPPVSRRLDESFSARTVDPRSKSAPRVRPPPPPLPSPLVKEAPPVVHVPAPPLIQNRNVPSNGRNVTMDRSGIQRPATQTATATKTATKTATTSTPPLPPKIPSNKGKKEVLGKAPPSPMQTYGGNFNGAVPKAVGAPKMNAGLSVSQTEEEPELETEHERNGGVNTPLTSPRRVMLRNMRAFADTPTGGEEKKESPVSTQNNDKSLWQQMQQQQGRVPTKLPPTSIRNNSSASTNRVGVVLLPAETKIKPTNELRLVKELRQAHDAKTEALKRVTSLEGEMKQLKRISKTPSSPSFEKLVQVAKIKGDTAALKWARGQMEASAIMGSNPPQQSFSQVGFLSPAPGSGGISGAMSPMRSGGISSAMSPMQTRNRVSTPHPKRRVLSDDEKQNERKFLVSAVMAVPCEYTSALATYIVRQPYTDETTKATEEDVNRSINWNTGKDEYIGVTDVGQSRTVEIMAEIAADASILTLSGASTVRHRKSDGVWKTYENVDEMAKPLGCVTYIDSDASEKEYWLDAIYEEALATREAYCSSITSTASALQASNLRENKEVILPPPVLVREVPVETPVYTERPKPQTMDACVGTEDMSFDPAQTQPSLEAQAVAPKEVPSTHKPLSSTVVKEMNAPEPSATPPTEEEDAAHDVLSVMLAWVFTFCFKLVSTVFVTLPIKLFSFMVFGMVTVTLLSVLWMYVANDNGAQYMGAGMEHSFNPSGLF